MRTVEIRIGGVPIGEYPTWAYPKGEHLGVFSIPVYSCTVTGSDDTGKSVLEKFTVLRFGVMCKDGKTPQVVGLADHQKHMIKAWIGSYRVHSARSDENGAWQVYDNFLIHDGPDNTSELFASIGCIEITGSQGFSKFNDLIIKLSGSKATSREAQLSEIGRSGTMWITYNAAQRPPLKKK
ncbi:MAG: hypothetical protein FWG26_07895 [Betaproteobacteria bacterium]|jgi:hypothetical protein|nr:hypothetical protein [Betaproteobacteria bacterium]